MGIVEEGLFKERNRKHYFSSTRLHPLSRNVKDVVYGKNVQSVCCVSGVADETVARIVSECSKLWHKEYKQVRLC